MKKLAQLAQDNFKITFPVIGEVVGIDDPLKRDRIQCRLVGITSDDVSDENCPWCEQKANLFSGSKDTSGVSTVPDVGSFVYVEFLYGNIESPLYTGYVRGAEDSSIVHKMKETPHPTIKARDDNKIGPELDSLNSSTEYPKNNVIETLTGSLIELDDTEGNERIAIEHKSGAYFEIRPDGTLVLKSSNGDMYHLVKGNLETYVTENENKEVKGNVSETVDGNVQETTSGKMDTTVTGNMTLKGANIFLN